MSNYIIGYAKLSTYDMRLPAVCCGASHVAPKGGPKCRKPIGLSY